MDNEPIDVEYIKEDVPNINGKALYLSTGQVALLLDETDSTLRFWCTKFKDILNIETTGTHRKFKEEDIEKLKYIKNLLRNEKYSIAQVSQYCSETDTSVMKKTVEQDPMALRALATAIAIEIGGQLEDYKLQIRNEIIAEVREEFKNQNELQAQQHKEAKEFIAITIEDNIKDKFETQMTDFKSYIDNMEQSFTKKLNEREDKLKHNMDVKKEEQKLLQEAESNKKRGFLYRLFTK